MDGVAAAAALAGAGAAAKGDVTAGLAAAMSLAPNKEGVAGLGFGAKGDVTAGLAAAMSLGPNRDGAAALGLAAGAPKSAFAVSGPAVGAAAFVKLAFFALVTSASLKSDIADQRVTNGDAGGKQQQLP